jgi:hypothetical protein
LAWEHQLDSWEVAFREKSRRRSSKGISTKAMKAGILLLLAASLGAAIYLRVAGIR